MSEEVKKIKETCHHGIPMSEESYNEWRKSFQEIEESIGLVMKEGEDLGVKN